MGKKALCGVESVNLLINAIKSKIKHDTLCNFDENGECILKCRCILKNS